MGYDASQNMGTNLEATRAFITAGNAYFTIENTRTGGRFTFRVKRSNNREDRFWVSVLTGPDNTRSYTFLGSLYSGESFRYFHSNRSEITSNAASAKAAEFFFAALNRNLPAALRVYHANRCCRCARQLTTPESVMSGIGPVCAGL